MSLLQNWREFAYSQDMNSKKGQMFWAGYFNLEQGIYEKILAQPDKVWEGTVSELAKEFDMQLSYFVGFLDGINDSLINPNPTDTMDENTVVNLGFDKEKLYMNMVAARATWLYELPAWDNLLTPERRKELYHEQKISGTVVKEKKISRNDPCPCGSGKKYKFCCGR